MNFDDLLESYVIVGYLTHPVNPRCISDTWTVLEQYPLEDLDYLTICLGGSYHPPRGIEKWAIDSLRDMIAIIRDQKEEKRQAFFAKP